VKAGFERNIDVKPRGTKAKRWLIDVGDQPAPGVYTVTIGAVHFWEPETGQAFDPGKKTAIGDLVVKIQVPGEGS
jgi:hypothetical protein